MYTVTFHIPGTLAANITPKWTFERDAKLMHVSAVASNDSDATLKIGTPTDDDAYLVAAVIGDSGTPVVKNKSNFVGTRNPIIRKGSTLVLTLDYDGSAGTAAQNVTIVLTFQQLRF